MSVLFIHSGYLKLNLCFNQIPARGESLLHVDGLEPNKKYIFAVAAFNAQGKIVGGAIGETTRPLLASLPLPLLTAWAHIAQVNGSTFIVCHVK